MTARASRKRRTTTTMPPVEPTPRNAAESEGVPPAGHPEVKAIERADVVGGDLVRLDNGQVRRIALPDGMAQRGVVPLSPPLLPPYQYPCDSAPYQLPDGTWEVLTLDADGRVTGRRTVPAPSLKSRIEGILTRRDKAQADGDHSLAEQLTQEAEAILDGGPK